jgi:SAM-dependent methyltransferase
MRLLAGAESAAEARVAAVGSGAGAALGPLLTDEAHALVRRMLAIADHDTPATPEGWAAVFDRAAQLSPEGSVALYTLGDAGRLAAATAEVVDWLADEALLGRGRRVLEIGCGIGRFVQAIAPACALTVGVDVSPVMTAETARRTARLAGAAVVRTAGRDLAAFADAAFNLVLAVDSWPYVVNVGLSATLAREAARVLRPGGEFVVLNWSYRGDAAEDRAEAAGLAAALGLRLDDGAAPALRHWNGVLFRFFKPRG